MTKEIQETVKELEKILDDPAYTEKIEGIIAIATAIDWGEALDQAEGELGEKREKIPNDSILNDFQTIGFNEMHDIAKPIIANLLLKIKELENGRDKRNY